MSPLGVAAALRVAICVLGAAALALAVGGGCDASWSRPTPIVAEPGLPCGRIYHQCPSGGCCAEDEVCRPGGYCAYVGGPGPFWGSRRDGGGESLRPQLSPVEAQKAGPR